MVDFEQLKRLVAESVALERKLRSGRDFRGHSCHLYLRLQSILEAIERIDRDDAAAVAFAAKVKPLIQKRMDNMRENNEFNPISLAIHEMSELDLFILDKHLSSDDFHVRLDAVAAVGELRYRAALPRLVSLLEREEHPWVISKLAKVIGEVGDEKVIPILVPLLDHEDDRVRANTVEGLDSIEGDGKYPHIMRMLHDSSDRVKAGALKALRSLGGNEFTSLVKRMVRSPQAETRMSLFHVLSGMHNRFARDRLIDLLDDRDPGIQIKAAAMLAGYIDEVTVRKLVSVVTNTSSGKLKETCLASLRSIRGKAPRDFVDRLNSLIRQAMHETAESGDTPPASSDEEVVVVIEDQSAGAATPAHDRNDERTGAEEHPSPGEGSDDDLLLELAEYSKPGDIAPSRVAQVARIRQAAAAGGLDRDLAREEAVKKTLARLHAVLSKLEPRVKLEIETLVKKGKIKNEAHVKQYLDRRKRKS